ncbi:MAG: protein translocase subunit SecD [Cyanobacteria bacterium P01_A01_bin.84]
MRNQQKKPMLRNKQFRRSLLVLILSLVIAAIWVIAIRPIPLGLDLRGGSQLTIQVKTTDKVKNITPRDLEAVQTVLSNRVNGLGVSESVIQPIRENNQISVQLPGIDDPKAAERVLGGTAQLEFRRENREKNSLVQVRREELTKLLFEEKPKLDKKGDKAAIAALDTKIAEKQKQLLDAEKNLFEKTELTGEYLKDAEQGIDNAGNWVVSIQFDTKGADLFAQLSKEAAQNGTRLGIFLDNEQISSPTVSPQYSNTGITGGSAQISGNFDDKSSRELALQLKGGALPLPVEIVENRTVGATLGRDSIQRSIYAGLCGLVLVLIFMVVYYRLPGIIANVALVIYALLNLAAFALIPITLTLPGIAGFILSIGMAVDANVLIFERTREELRTGKSLFQAVESGFDRAFSSILDSNVTTLIACGALIQLGSGFVKGFAVTLGLGVLISMITAVTCSGVLMYESTSVKRRELFCPNLPSTKRAEVI